MTPYEAIALAAITVLALTAIVSFLATELGEDWNNEHH
jgi:hypothetical protein